MTDSNGSNGTAAKELGREQRELPCKLNDLELRARGDEMAEAELGIDKLKETRRGINGQIADLSTTRAKLAVTIEAREEERMVACTWIEDLPQNRRKLIRQDTGEEVDVRALTAEDHQAKLGFGDAPANDNARAAGPGDSDDDSDDDSDEDDEDDDESTVVVEDEDTGEVRTVTSLAAARKRKASSKGVGVVKRKAAKGGKASKAKGSKGSKHTRHTHI